MILFLSFLRIRHFEIADCRDGQYEKSIPISMLLKLSVICNLDFGHNKGLSMSLHRAPLVVVVTLEIFSWLTLVFHDIGLMFCCYQCCWRLVPREKQCKSGEEIWSGQKRYLWGTRRWELKSCSCNIFGQIKTETGKMFPKGEKRCNLMKM